MLDRCFLSPEYDDDSAKHFVRSDYRNLQNEKLEAEYA